MPLPSFRLAQEIAKTLEVPAEVLWKIIKISR